jgi:predicted TIM-barrel fold metal-dependent hydrolase
MQKVRVSEEVLLYRPIDSEVIKPEYRIDLENHGFSERMYIRPNWQENGCKAESETALL